MKIIYTMIVSLFLMITSIEAEILTIGIAGGTGSGKTTLAHKIQEALCEQSVLISQDFYYKDLSHLSHEERNAMNFDHPDSIDIELMHAQIEQLKNGEMISSPQYDFISHTRKFEKIKIEPARIIIVEGILLFAVPELRDLFDWKIFIDVDDDIRLLRRIERDISKRGRSFNSVKDQYLATVKPMHHAFVQPSKQYADIIIPKGGENQIALDLILSKLYEQVYQEFSIRMATH